MMDEVFRNEVPQPNPPSPPIAIPLLKPDTKSLVRFFPLTIVAVTATIVA
jgi:hypothetical protein